MKDEKDMKRKVFYITTTICLACSFFSCGQNDLLTNANDTSYIIFDKDMTTDTTTVSFKFYNEGEDAKIALGVNIYGKLQEKDLIFSLGFDPDRTTLPESQFELPEKCVIKAGELTSEVIITLKNYDVLKENSKLLALKVNEEGEVREGAAKYSRAIIAVTDRIFKPDWWTVDNGGSVSNPHNIAEEYYLGAYSVKKYLMFLDELKKDDVVFDGKDMNILRKYSIRLKNTLKEINGGLSKDKWLRDENGVIIEVPIAG